MRLLVLLALSMGVAGLVSALNPNESPVLELANKFVRELSGDGSHEHNVPLRAGEYAHVRIAQNTVNIAVAVFDPACKQLFALDGSFIGEAEDVEWIAADSG